LAHPELGCFTTQLILLIDQFKVKNFLEQKMNVFNLSRLTENMFRRADGVVWDVMTGKIGIVTDEGIATLEGEGDDAVVNINLVNDFGVAVPAYAQSTQQADVKVGDIIITGAKGNISWVIERKETDTGVKYKTMRPSGESGSWSPPKKTVMGFDTGVMVLRPLMSMTGDGGMQNMQQTMMMMAMMSQGGNGGISANAFDKIMPLMLMGGSNAQNPMQMMLMMQMMQGGLGNQPVQRQNNYFDTRGQ
jgi:hypothetical protein